MSRFSESDLEHLKRSVDLAALIRSKGIELKPHGSKDLKGLCPFHEDHNPSLIVSPAKNLYHCPACGAGGDVIKFLMEHDKLSFRHAVELLKEQNPQVFGAVPATVRNLECPLDPEAPDEELFAQVMRYYHEQLKQSPDALDYLQKRGITLEAIDHFQIGYADRTLGLRLPLKNRVGGETLRTRLQKLGLYRETGREHLNGCVVFPIRPLRAYGRRIFKSKNPDEKHFYLPGPHRGLWNPEAFQEPTVILCESVIDALSFWCAGLRNCSCTYGNEGWTSDHTEAFKSKLIQRVYLAYDPDDPGQRAADRDAARLLSMGLEVFRVRFPGGLDANEFALKEPPASKSLPALLNGAEWMGKAGGQTGGQRTEDGGRTGGQRSEDGGQPETVTPTDVTAGADSSIPIYNKAASSLAANSLAANDLAVTPASSRSSSADDKQDACATNQTASFLAANDLAAKNKSSNGQSPDSPPVTHNSPLIAQGLPAIALAKAGEDLSLTLGDRVYRVRGLAKNASPDALKVSLRLMVPAGRFHLDTLDLCRAKDRQGFVSAAAAETGLSPDLIQRDLGKLLLALEQHLDSLHQTAQKQEPEAPAMSDQEREAALLLLRDPRLLDRIQEEFEACGIVGERTNKLAAYIAAVSRLLEKPLAIIIQSTSAAGKTSLMDAVLSMMPEAHRLKFSALTGQALYYLGESNLQHKILAIVEEEGAEKASYPLKLLQSEGELRIASTGKDELGRLRTEEHYVKGPVMIFLTTTAIDIDEELQNRCIILTVDESREQTAAIHALQREAETLEGLERRLGRQAILQVHRHAQELLKPVHVVNPFARQLTFMSERTRTRRDHMKYLTLIRTITLLHQYQRPQKQKGGLPYIEVSLGDIAAANRIAHEVLGRCLDELPPQTRRLLGLLKTMVEGLCQEKHLDRDQCFFTRRQLREVTGWGDTQLKVHLARLVDMEYLQIRRSPDNPFGFSYELLYDGDLSAQKPHLSGLLDVEKLRSQIEKHDYDASRSGSEESQSGAGRPPVGGWSGGGRDGGIDSKPAQKAASESTDDQTAKNAQPDEKKSGDGTVERAA